MLLVLSKRLGVDETEHLLGVHIDTGIFASIVERAVMKHVLFARHAMQLARARIHLGIMIKNATVLGTVEHGGLILRHVGRSRHGDATILMHLRRM